MAVVMIDGVRYEAKQRNQKSSELLFATPYDLPVLFESPLDEARLRDEAEDAVAVTAYGVGRVSGVTYTVPAHGEIEVDFTVRLLCITPEDVRNLSNLIRSLIDASRHGYWNDYSRTDVSGGASLFGFFSLGVRASYTQVKQRMEWWGLSETNQRTIVDKMTEIANKTSDFHYRGTVHNRDYDYAVSGNMFCIVMDATIQQGTTQYQHRYIAPRPHLRGSGGESLPSLGDLYEV
jgi:hypothetical protein